MPVLCIKYEKEELMEAELVEDNEDPLPMDLDAMADLGKFWKCKI
jgi:hypothetical protein